MGHSAEASFSINSVRLACVRHAASVHPEPGSNSLKFVSYPVSRLQSIPELVLLFFYQETSVSRNYFFASLDANLRVPCFSRCLIFKVLVTCFFGSFAPSQAHPVFQVLDYNTTLDPFCQHLFLIFSPFFANSLLLLRAFRTTVNKGLMRRLFSASAT